MYCWCCSSYWRVTLLSPHRWPRGCALRYWVESPPQLGLLLSSTSSTWLAPATDTMTCTVLSVSHWLSSPLQSRDSPRHGTAWTGGWVGGLAALWGVMLHWSTWHVHFWWAWRWGYFLSLDSDKYLGYTTGIVDQPLCIPTVSWSLCFALQCKQRFQKLKDVTDLQEKCKKLRDQLEQWVVGVQTAHYSCLHSYNRDL